MKKGSFLLFLLLASTALFSDCIEEVLQKIPQDEQEKIESFFDFALKLGHVGHVLYFENKAVAMLGIGLEAECDIKFREGWYTFKKYKELFPCKNFIFNERLKNFSLIQAIHIYLINKKAVVKCVDSHIRIFQEILRKKIDGRQFLSKLESGVQLMDLIKENEILLGVLLGYGEESARLYYQKSLEHHQDIYLDNNYITITPELIDGIEIFPVAFKGHLKSKQAKTMSAKLEEEWRQLWEMYLANHKNSTRFFLEALCR